MDFSHIGQYGVYVSAENGGVSGLTVSNDSFFDVSPALWSP